MDRNADLIDLLHALNAEGCREPNQIDVITTIDGITFQEAWENRVTSRYGDEPVYFIGKDELIKNKKAAGRPQDLADVAYLQTLDRT